MKNFVSRFRALAVCAVSSLLLWSLQARAQSDNFDTGTLDPAWKRSNFNPALVNTTFPDLGTGKALRIKGNPVPNAAPAAALFYRDEVYTNFYMAVDLVDWPGTDKDQAVVLVARGTLSGNPATTAGIILNYDASQEGEGATDRRQGQLQINMVTNDPPFGTKTLAVAEVTFQPGRSYRLVFKGEGSQYTGMAYDVTDLTRPLVTIHADDAIQASQPGGGLLFDFAFASGKSGILVFSRDGTTGTTDVTIDNYYAGPSDPNPAAGTALAHPVAGTPIVESRNPAGRFENFHNPADGLSFVVKTHTDNQINTSATKLRLNGVDVSSQLALPANGASATISLPGSALASNTVYTAQIEVEDVSGTKKSTNLFWFDTFSEPYLASAGVKTIEAEEYNFDGGQFKNDPIVVSGYDASGNVINQNGEGYLELTGTEGIDYHDARTSAEGTWAAEFRSADMVGLSAGMFPEIEDVTEGSDVKRYSDQVRSSRAALNLLEYVVHRTEPGEWLNYTRQFAAGAYVPYLRVASFGATDIELHQVTGDRTQPDQATSKLGTFKVPNNFTRYYYRYVPLVNDQGQPATIDLPAGPSTLRLLMAGTAGQDARKVAINYLLLAPPAATPAPSVKLFAANTIDGAFAEVAAAVIDGQARSITIPMSGAARFFIVSSAAQVRIQRAQVSGNTLTLTYQ